MWCHSRVGITICETMLVMGSGDYAKATAAVEQGGASICHAAEKYVKLIPHYTLPTQANYYTIHTSYTAHLPLDSPTFEIFAFQNLFNFTALHTCMPILTKL